jgi:7,8-dihydropterin-6-yl-methyl-4-(beta-D-ribofuranosyl)aminobenzene 5'-phosphate synthase
MSERFVGDGRLRLSGRYGRPMGPGVPVGERSAERVTALFDATLIVTALVVNVRGRGLVVITGCGHPEIELTLAAAEKVVDAPVYAVIGGLHLPVHPIGTPLLPHAVLGNPNWPWRPISEEDARSVIQSIQQRGPGLIALSGHDSAQWTLDEFGHAFGEPLPDAAGG